MARAQTAAIWLPPAKSSGAPPRAARLSRAAATTCIGSPTAAKTAWGPASSGSWAAVNPSCTSRCFSW